MRQTEQYKTGKHGYVTETQQQQGLATFLSAKHKMSFSSGRGLEEAAVTLPGDTCSSRDTAVAGALTSNPRLLSGPKRLSHHFSKHRSFLLFCCCWFFLVQNVKTVGFKTQPKHQL